MLKPNHEPRNFMKIMAALVAPWRFQKNLTPNVMRLPHTLHIDLFANTKLGL
jgi:hypothetical protein